MAVVWCLWGGQGMVTRWSWGAYKHQRSGCILIATHDKKKTSWRAHQNWEQNIQSDGTGSRTKAGGERAPAGRPPRPTDAPPPFISPVQTPPSELPPSTTPSPLTVDALRRESEIP